MPPGASVRAIRIVIAASLSLGVTAAIVLAAEKPIAPEHNPPGDIPDTQVFVNYASPLGFTIKVPEGWSRAEQPQSVRFSDKYNTIVVAVSALTALSSATSKTATICLPSLS